MSGGHFNFKQYCITDVIETITQLINDNEYPPAVIEKFKLAHTHLTLAFIYTQRIDWLVSGDDGEDTFLLRLHNELEEAQNGMVI